MSVIADSLIVDIAFGTTDSRLELNDVLALAKQRKIDTLLVWKVDRLVRTSDTW